MKIFLKAQFSSLIATAVDFLVMICLVEFLKLHDAVAVIFGAMAGAITNFFVNRYWSFEVADRPVRQQSFKYLLVWTGSVSLNVIGVYLLTQFFKMNSILLGVQSLVLSKIIVSVIVGLSFNYVLQKKYVFSTK